MYSHASPLPVFVGVLSASEQLVLPQYVIKANKYRRTTFKSVVFLFSGFAENK